MASIASAAAVITAAEKVLAIVNIVAGYAHLAEQIGEDAKPFIAFVQRVSAAQVVTQADVDELHAMSKPYLDMLNDTSRDAA